MLIAFSVAPTVAADDTGSVSDAVARAIRVVRDSGLPHRTDAMFTTIEGEWDECMAVVKQCCDVLAETSPRVGLVLKADIRPGLDGRARRQARAARGCARSVSRMTEGGWRLRPLAPEDCDELGPRAHGDLARRIRRFHASRLPRRAERRTLRGQLA